MINLKIRELKVGLIDFLDRNELPTEVKRMVLEDVLEDATQKANDAIMAELNQREMGKGEPKKVDQVKWGNFPKEETYTRFSNTNKMDVAPDDSDEHLISQDIGEKEVKTDAESVCKD